MAKPILVINYCIEGLTPEQIVRNFKELRTVVESARINDDYYTFFLPIKSDSHIQVFYDKDLDPTSYDELKTMMEEKLEEFKWKK
jgi:hypothetical protein